jgi:hypothetical protein
MGTSTVTGRNWNEKGWLGLLEVITSVAALILGSVKSQTLLQVCLVKSAVDQKLLTLRMHNIVKFVGG